MFRNQMPRYEVLSESAMEALDAGWRRLLTEVGVEFVSDRALDLFRAAGQKVEDGTVYLDPDFVLDQVGKAPREFDVAARNPEHSIHIGGDAMAFGAVYGPPFVREGEVRRDATMDDFFRRLKANGVRIVDGNSVVRDLVARGEVKIGLTDTDDVNVEIEDGQPIAMVLPDATGLGVPVMPNMVSLIAQGPHPEEGRRLIDYLLSQDVERQLAQSEAVQIPLHAGVQGPRNIPGIETFKPMTLDYTKASTRVEDVTGRLAGILGL